MKEDEVRKKGRCAGRAKEVEGVERWDAGEWKKLTALDEAVEVEG